MTNSDPSAPAALGLGGFLPRLSLPSFGMGLFDFPTPGLTGPVSPVATGQVTGLLPMSGPTGGSLLGPERFAPLQAAAANSRF